jgi:hypothetical protein
MQCKFTCRHEVAPEIALHKSSGTFSRFAPLLRMQESHHRGRQYNAMQSISRYHRDPKKPSSTSQVALSSSPTHVPSSYPSLWSPLRTPAPPTCMYFPKDFTTRDTAGAASISRAMYRGSRVTCPLGMMNPVFNIKHSNFRPLIDNSKLGPSSIPWLPYDAYVYVRTHGRTATQRLEITTHTHIHTHTHPHTHTSTHTHRQDVYASISASAVHTHKTAS